MDKKDYIDTLKDLNLRPGKVKVREKEEQVLLEDEQPKEPEILKELFVEANEVSSMPAGPRRDMAILRLGIVAEYDAVNLYEKLAGLASDENIKKVMLHVANEEKEHVGEFEFLLEHIDPEHDEYEDKGEDEAEELTGLEDD